MKNIKPGVVITFMERGATVRMYDTDDEIQKSLSNKIETIEKKMKASIGLFSGVNRFFLRREQRTLLLKYDERALELGGRKPSGYHG